MYGFKKRHNNGVLEFKHKYFRRDGKIIFESNQEKKWNRNGLADTWSGRYQCINWSAEINAIKSAESNSKCGIIKLLYNELNYASLATNGRN